MLRDRPRDYTHWDGLGDHKLCDRSREYSSGIGQKHPWDRLRDYNLCDRHIGYASGIG
jgi:hypothetical protein